MLTDASPWELSSAAGSDELPHRVATMGIPDKVAHWEAYRVRISSSFNVKRRSVSWEGMAAEVVETTGQYRTEYHRDSPMHMVAVCDLGEHRTGSTFVDGLPRSGLCDLTARITVVPAGSVYQERQESCGLTRRIFLYLDPAKTLDSGLIEPRLHVEDPTFHALAQRMKSAIEAPSHETPYIEALGLVMAGELQGLARKPPGAYPRIRGGLTKWQQQAVTDYIERHIANNISLVTLAALARVSYFHFSRAFKQSFGVPPHRYHLMRRIELAKTLLANSTMSVTDVGMAVGFSDASAFATTFRRFTGTPPSHYGRISMSNPRDGLPHLQT